MTKIKTQDELSLKISRINLEREMISFIDDQLGLIQEMRKWLDQNSKNNFLYDIIQNRYNFMFQRVKKSIEDHESFVSLPVVEEEKKE